MIDCLTRAINAGSDEDSLIDLKQGRLMIWRVYEFENKKEKREEKLRSC